MYVYKEISLKNIDDLVLYLKNKKYPFFLDSGTSFPKIGQYSFWGYNPIFRFYFKDKNVYFFYENKKETHNIDPFVFLNKILKKFSLKKKGNFPFNCGLVGFLSYELGKFIEKLPDTRIDDYNIPELYFAGYDIVGVYDHFNNKAYITGYDFGFNDFNKRFAEAALIFENDFYSEKGDNFELGKELISNFEKQEYIEAIKKAKEYIYAGDIYQVNLSQRFKLEFHGCPYKFYKIFRKISPAPFGAFLDYGNFQFLSNSPERYLLIKGEHIETRPIKGTRPRGKTKEEDLFFIEELKNSIKDKAEHLMIVDLERNDLGRIAKFNSVRVSEFEIIEHYSNVHHMVSTVEAKISPKFTNVDCIKNSYPGGSITGAPKIRAMEIIDELEPTYRSVYTGSIGYIDFSGDLDLNIAIRTAIIKDDFINFQVGGGIVADSDPEEEYIETIVKAESFIKTLKKIES